MTISHLNVHTQTPVKSHILGRRQDECDGVVQGNVKGLIREDTNAVSNVLKKAAVASVAGAAGYSVLRTAAEMVSAQHAGPKTFADLLAQTPKVGLRVAVIGTGISGTQALKACLEEGMEPTGFEVDSEIGGFWRFKENEQHPSVYKSTHIDTDRDMNSYGDRPWHKDAPLLIHNTALFQYLKANHEEFGLTKLIRFNTKVEFVTPKSESPELDFTETDPKKLRHTNRWLVTSVEIEQESGNPIEATRKTEEYDAVLVCTGRHGGGGYIPFFPGLDRFKGKYLHSSQYKYPEKHSLQGKNVVVIGIGNSGCDIVTELGMFNKGNSQTILVSRSGGWVHKSEHLESFMSKRPIDRTTIAMSSRIPWWVADEMTTRLSPELVHNQEVLNKHGLKPKHKRMQQHLIATGLAGQTTLQDQLELGWIKVKKDIIRFTETGIVFVDAKGQIERKETKVDFVVFATGYKQQAGFIDPRIVDMRFEREGNDVPLWKGCLPISEFKGLGFINFIQSITFVCAELQSRFCVRAFKGLIPIPSLDEQRHEMIETRNALTARFIDRNQLKVQHGTDFRYYEDLALLIGCQPTFKKILTERPTAFWHAYFTQWQPLQWRLVGPGRLETAEKSIEDMFESRYYGTYKNENNPDFGKSKPGVSPFYTARTVLLWLSIHALILKAKYVDKLSAGYQIRDDLEQNIKFAQQNDAKLGIQHSFTINEREHDGFKGKKEFAFKNRQSTSVPTGKAENMASTDQNSNHGKLQSSL